MSTPTGLYGSITNLYDIFGQTNIATWSDMTNSTPPNEDSVREQNAINWADGKINMSFNNSRYAVPLASADPYSLQVLANWEAVFASAFLYARYGVRDDDQQYNHIQTELKRVRTEMGMVRIGRDFLNCTLSTHQTTLPGIVAQI